MIMYKVKHDHLGSTEFKVFQLVVIFWPENVLFRFSSASFPAAAKKKNNNCTLRAQHQTANKLNILYFACEDFASVLHPSESDVHPQDFIGTLKNNNRV